MARCGLALSPASPLRSSVHACVTQATAPLATGARARLSDEPLVRRVHAAPPVPPCCFSLSTQSQRQHSLPPHPPTPSDPPLRRLALVVQVGADAIERGIHEIEARRAPSDDPKAAACWQPSNHVQLPCQTHAAPPRPASRSACRSGETRTTEHGGCVPSPRAPRGPQPALPRARPPQPSLAAGPAPLHPPTLADARSPRPHASAEPEPLASPTAWP